MSLAACSLSAFKQPASLPSIIVLAKRGEVMVTTRSANSTPVNSKGRSSTSALRSSSKSTSVDNSTPSNNDGKRLVVILFCLFFNQVMAFVAGAGSKTHHLHLLGFASIAIQWVIFVHACGIFTGGKRTEKYYDLTGSSTFLILTVISYVHGAAVKSWRQNTLSAFVIIWCTRLGAYLFSRIVKEGGIDARFTKVKEDFLYFFLFWNVQGVWNFVCALPVYALNCKVDSNLAITTYDKVGIAVYVLGLLLEVVADYQKSAFKADKKNHGKFIKHGLWSISRHPNYLGEILIHVGIFLVSYSSITSVMEYSWVVAPLFVSLLLIYVSGIPPLEKLGERRWGHLKEYQAYKKETSVLVPFLKL